MSRSTDISVKTQVTSKSTRKSLVPEELKDCVSRTGDEEIFMPGIAYLESDFELWEKTRQATYFLLFSGPFETTMTMIILFNIVLMAIEVDAVAGCPSFEDVCTPTYVTISNYALLGVYTAEVMLHIFIERSRFYRIRWNYLDSSVVACGYIEVCLNGIVDSQTLSTVRILRLLRIIRAVKLFKHIRDLYRLVSGFLSTMRAIFWGFVMLLCLSFLFAVMTMQLVQEYRDMSQPDDWCSDAFSSVVKTVLFYFQTLIAGDSWGACVIPMVRKSWPLFFLFSSSLICITLGFTNLILSVIVDNAATDREEGSAEKVKLLREQEEADIISFYATMKRIDADRSGTLSLSELLNGFEEDTEAQARMASLTLDKGDLSDMFKALDTHDEDSVSYKDIVKTLDKAGKHDMRMQAMIMGLQLTKLTHSFEHRMNNLESLVLAAVTGQPVESFLPSSGTWRNSVADSSNVPNSPKMTMAPLVEQSFVPKMSKLPVLEHAKASTSPLSKSVFVDNDILNQEDFLKDHLVSGMAALEDDLRRMGVDLGGRLQSLAQETEKHRASVARHATVLGFRLAQVNGGVEKPVDMRDASRNHVDDQHFNVTDAMESSDRTISPSRNRRKSPGTANSNSDEIHVEETM